MKRPAQRHIIQPSRAQRPESELVSCCVGGCRRLCGIASDGYLLPCCKAHAELLPERLYRAAEKLAGFSAFDPLAVLECALLVLRTKAALGAKTRGRR